MRINSVEDLVRAGLPLRVIHDIGKRITDWRAVRRRPRRSICKAAI